MFLDTFQILAVETVASSGNPAVDIAREFKVQWPTFFAQLINFAIILFVLKKFAFGPVQEMLAQRRKRIADGEAKLAEVEKQIAESEQRTQEMIDKANGQAKRMVEEAKESAALLSEKKTKEAVAAAQQILAKAEEAARAERDQMQVDLRKEFGRLVTSTTAQVTGKVLTDDDQRRINEEALAKVEG